MTRTTSSKLVIPSASFRSADCRSVRMPRFIAAAIPRSRDGVAVAEQKQRRYGHRAARRC